MSICMSGRYQLGLQKAAQVIDKEYLQNRSILITGATGLIGSAIVDLLLWMNKHYALGVLVYAASRDISKVYDRFKPFSAEDGLFAIKYDALQKICFDFHVDYIIHAASNANPEEYITYPVDTMLGNIIGIRELLEYAKCIGAKKTIYVSSSEVYGIRSGTTAIKENEYGYVNLLNSRSSYAMGKRATETLCISYAKQYGCNVSIVRPGHIYGPTAQNTDHRVVSEFARLVAQEKDIVLKSEGTQIRSYCHCLDCATAILTVLNKGKPAEAYNISNKDSVITIRQMAELLASYGKVKLLFDLPTKSEREAFNPMENSSLDSERLEQLGWYGVFDPEEGFENTVTAMKEILGSSSVSQMENGAAIL